MAEKKGPRAPGGLHVVGLVNQKGGSGKTTTCLNVAGALVEQGFRVLLVDLDPQASLSDVLDLAPLPDHHLSRTLLRDNTDVMDLIQPTPLDGISLIAGDGQLRELELAMGEISGRELRLRRAIGAHLPALTERFDYILIDCPPALGYLTANANNAATEVLLPMNLDKMGVNALADTLRSIGVVRQTTNAALRVLGILPTQVNMRTKLDQARDAYLRQQYDGDVFQTTIPSSVQVKEAMEMSVPVTHYARRGAVARRYRKLVDEILEREARYA
ncbi:MAG: AAA family ATPase [Chloroflexota bacterium]